MGNHAHWTKAQLLWVLVILNKEDKIREVVSVHLTCKVSRKMGYDCPAYGFFLSLCLPVGYFFFFNQEQNIDLSIFCAENVVSSQLSLLFLVP